VNATALIFAKYPTPGQVKTRLVPPLTPEEAANLHRASLAATCELVRAAGVSRSVLVVTPDDATHRLADELCEPEPQAEHSPGAPGACAVLREPPEHSMQNARQLDDTWSQGTGSLGERLVRAADRAFAEGASKVLLFGADSPTIPMDHIHEAIASLGRHPAVIGPCDDGGYYLLGLASPQPVLFDGIDWGSERVAEQTRAQARAAGIDLHELPAWHDIDRWSDLERAALSLAGYDDLGRNRAALRNMIRRLLARPRDGRA